MGITIEQALMLATFHYVGASLRGEPKCFVWRRNGRTKTWVTRPGHYRVPVKYGMYSTGYIDAPEMVQDGTASGANVYAPNECPVCHGTKH